MMKYGLLVLVVLLVAAFALAQTKAKAPAAGGPTKVTGDGTKTSTGLQYWDIKVGTGRMADKGNTVNVHYTGWLTNGKKFDSSVGGQPFHLPHRRASGDRGLGRRRDRDESRGQAPAANPSGPSLREGRLSGRNPAERDADLRYRIAGVSRIEGSTTTKELWTFHRCSEPDTSAGIAARCRQTHECSEAGNSLRASLVSCCVFRFR